MLPKSHTGMPKGGSSKPGIRRHANIAPAQQKARRQPELPTGCRSVQLQSLTPE